MCIWHKNKCERTFSCISSVLDQLIPVSQRQQKISSLHTGLRYYLPRQSYGVEWLTSSLTLQNPIFLMYAQYSCSSDLKMVSIYDSTVCSLGGKLSHVKQSWCHVWKTKNQWQLIWTVVHPICFEPKPHLFMRSHIPVSILRQTVSMILKICSTNSLFKKSVKSVIVSWDVCDLTFVKFVVLLWLMFKWS